MGFNCLKATEPLRESTLLFINSLPLFTTFFYLHFHRTGAWKEERSMKNIFSDNSQYVKKLRKPPSLLFSKPLPQLSELIPF